MPSGLRAALLVLATYCALCCAPSYAAIADALGNDEGPQLFAPQSAAFLSDTLPAEDGRDDEPDAALGYVMQPVAFGDAFSEETFRSDRFRSPGEFAEYEMKLEVERLTKILKNSDPAEPGTLEAMFDDYANRIIGWPYEHLVASWVSPPLIRFITPARLELGGTLKGGTARSWTGIFKSRWLQDEKWIYSRADFSVRYTSVDSTRSENEQIATELLDLRSQSSPWVIFSKSYAEHDEVEKLAFRGTFAMGPGYRWLDRKDFAVLVTRVGPAATYENFYDPKRSELKPEMVAEVEMKFVFGRATYEQLLTTYSNLQDMDRFRSSAITDLLIPLDAARHWNWKTGFRHTYNGQPNAGVNHNEFEGTFSLVYIR